MSVTYTTHACHMHITSHACHMHITSHACHMHITCTSHAYHMHITCLSHAHHMPITGTPHACHVGGTPISCMQYATGCPAHTTHSTPQLRPVRSTPSPQGCVTVHQLALPALARWHIENTVTIRATKPGGKNGTAVCVCVVCVCVCVCQCVYSITRTPSISHPPIPPIINDTQSP